MRKLIRIADSAIQAGATPQEPYPVVFAGLVAPDLAAADFEGLTTDTIGDHWVTLSPRGWLRLQQANPSVAAQDINLLPGRMTVLPPVTPRFIVLTRTITYVGAGAQTPPPLVQRVNVAVYTEIGGAGRVAYLPQGAFAAVPTPARFGFVPDRSVPAASPASGFTRPAHRFVTVTYLPAVIEYLLEPTDRAGNPIAPALRCYGLQGHAITTYPEYAAFERLPQPLRVPAVDGGRVRAIYVPADPWRPTPQAELEALAQALMPKATAVPPVATAEPAKAPRLLGAAKPQPASAAPDAGSAVPKTAGRPAVAPVDAPPSPAGGAAAESPKRPEAGPDHPAEPAEDRAALSLRSPEEPTLPLAVPADLVQPVRVKALLRRATRQLFGRRG
ncbi:hypothetical protein [Lacticaseibacillus parakribbianus]|uniref:hypothetical protein n=1 Tax=Lacticaseibacillus parakribbianus TaxID=2970927 RepID=UPI0021CB1E4C|nr:hypothetical protein [Lacticaseibacillus parakribbianus]